MEASLFGRLPPELRNNVSNCLLPLPTQLNIEVYRGAPKNAYGQEYDSIFAFARTCRGIAIELLSQFYGQNRFKIVVKPFYESSGGRPMLFGTPRKTWVREMREWLGEEQGPGKSAIKEVEFIVPGVTEIHTRRSDAADEQVSEILSLNVRSVREMFCPDATMNMSFGIIYRAPTSAPDRTFDMKLPLGDGLAIRDVLSGHENEQMVELAALDGVEQAGIDFVSALYPNFYADWWTRLETYFVHALE